MLEALCRSSGTTLDIRMSRDGPPITQRTSGLSGCKPEAFRRLPYSPMVVRHLRVRQAEMGERVVDRIGEGRYTAYIWRLADTLGADRMVRRRCGGEVGFPARRLDRGRQKEVEQARTRQIAGVVVGHSCPMAMASASVSPPWTCP